MEIRKARYEDLEEIMDIYAYARKFMIQTGNPRQWAGRNWPPQFLIEQDIRSGKSYVCVERTGNDGGPDRIRAVFFYDYGRDIEPCYAEIEDGYWAGDSPYGVVHRIASAEGTKGAGTCCIQWAFAQSGHLRIDTHPDNQVMQAFLKKQGFAYRGIIHVEEDDDPRYAYEKPV